MRTYPSKLLLFGEYTIIEGGQALALPYQRYSGHWSYGTNIIDMYELVAYLEKQKNKDFEIDIKALRGALDKGLFFESTIPAGYGMGSSGALTAAVYQVFCTPDARADIRQHKKNLAQIESFFHGSSSGIDPLVSYTGQAIWVKAKDEIASLQPPKRNDAAGTFFLIDTKVQRETAPLVGIFKQQMQAPDFSKKIHHQLIPHTNAAIAAFWKKDDSKLWKKINAISEFQYQHFQAMLLPSFKQIWAQSLQSNVFRLKLCGAGGGGFLLGYTQDFKTTQQLLKHIALQKVIF